MQPKNNTDFAPMQYDLPQDIFEGTCTVCGDSLTVRSRHVGGYALPQSFVVCLNPDGGEDHVSQRISEGLALQYLRLMDDMAKANDEWALQLESAFWTVFMGSEVA